jgi:hypothetical protein
MHPSRSEPHLGKGALTPYLVRASTEGNGSKAVRFGIVHVREYRRSISDNPSVTCGVPVGISWDVLANHTLRYLPFSSFYVYFLPFSSRMSCSSWRAFHVRVSAPSVFVYVCVSVYVLAASQTSSLIASPFGGIKNRLHGRVESISESAFRCAANVAYERL